MRSLCQSARFGIIQNAEYSLRRNLNQFPPITPARLAQASCGAGGDYRSLVCWSAGRGFRVQGSCTLWFKSHPPHTPSLHIASLQLCNYTITRSRNHTITQLSRLIEIILPACHKNTPVCAGLTLEGLLEEDFLTTSCVGTMMVLNERVCLSCDISSSSRRAAWLPIM